MWKHCSICDKSNSLGNQYTMCSEVIEISVCIVPVCDEKMFVLWVIHLTWWACNAVVKDTDTSIKHIERRQDEGWHFNPTMAEHVISYLHRFSCTTVDLDVNIIVILTNKVIQIPSLSIYYFTFYILMIIINDQDLEFIYLCMKLCIIFHVQHETGGCCLWFVFNLNSTMIVDSQIWQAWIGGNCSMCSFCTSNTRAYLLPPSCSFTAGDQ